MHFRTACVTDSGWCCICELQSFRELTDEEAWVDVFLDDDAMTQHLLDGTYLREKPNRTRPSADSSFESLPAS